MSLLQQNGLDLDVVGFGSSPVVVDKAGYLEQVQSGKMAFLIKVSTEAPGTAFASAGKRKPYTRGVVMVSVY